MKNHKSDSRRTFDKAAAHYEKRIYGRQSRKLYDNVALKLRGYKHRSILDLGCGTGNLFEKLQDGGSGLYGADISPEMIKYAREKSGGRAEFKVADSENIPWEDDYFDVVTCVLSFHHYPDPGKSLAEIKRVLGRSGHLILGEAWLPAPLRSLANLFLKSGFNTTGDVKVYSKSEWLDMLGAAGFVNIGIEKTGYFYIIVSGEIRK
jgi:ubiquinone/menaquinone biosynthesis C-methylase UbiE